MEHLYIEYLSTGAGGKDGAVLTNGVFLKIEDNSTPKEKAQEIIEMVQENIQNFSNRYGYDLISEQVIGECKTYVRDINEKAECRKKQLLIDLNNYNIVNIFLQTNLLIKTKFRYF